MTFRTLLQYKHMSVTYKNNKFPYNRFSYNPKSAADRSRHWRKERELYEPKYCGKEVFLIEQASNKDDCIERGLIAENTVYNHSLKELGCDTSINIRCQDTKELPLSAGMAIVFVNETDEILPSSNDIEKFHFLVVKKPFCKTNAYLKGKGKDDKYLEFHRNTNGRVENKHGTKTVLTSALREGTDESGLSEEFLESNLLKAESGVPYLYKVIYEASLGDKRVGHSFVSVIRYKNEEDLRKITSRIQILDLSEFKCDNKCHGACDCCKDCTHKCKDVLTFQDGCDKDHGVHVWTSRKYLGSENLQKIGEHIIHLIKKQ